MNKVLFIYPNAPLLNPPPVAIGIFTALLREEGFEVRIFDTTFHSRDEISSDKHKETTLQVKSFSFDSHGLPSPKSTPEKDLENFLVDYQPDLICMSVLESTWPGGVTLLDVVSNFDIPVCVGGVFATFAPQIVIAHPAVSMVCLGEGEKALVELCQRLRQGKNIDSINNLWVKQANGDIKKNKLGRVVDINLNPIPDYSAFHPARMLRPMAGRIYQTIPLETNRGCPYSCAFCNSPATARLYRQFKAGHFFRKKSISRIQQELSYLIKNFKAEYVYFLSDTFLSMNNAEFDNFIDIYSDFKLPFWIQTRAETITSHRVDKLKQIGCHRMSIGLEHGNPEYRAKMLKKKFSNRVIIEATKIIAEGKIPLTVNNIIGFPDESRELIFDTIELNRKLISDSVNAYIYIPYHGSFLHEYCLEKGYVSPGYFSGGITTGSPLNIPQISSDDIAGLCKTFVLYVKMPKKYWPEIKQAEQNNEKGNELFSKLKAIYTEKYSR
jgi:anaerobic magnesium-protoporphyrin IX monomethyl ester cyclase